MTYSVLETLPPFYGAYNRSYIGVSSSNVNEERFSYIADIFIIETDCATFLRGLTTSSLLNAANPDGIGEIEINNVCKDWVNWELNYDTDLQTYCEGNRNWELFSISLGEAYVKTWDADDFIFLTASNPNLSQLCLTTDVAFGATFSDIPHHYSLFDTIYINSPDEDFVKSGVWRITEIVSTKTIRLNQEWQQPGPSLTISTKYADRRLSYFRDLAKAGFDPDDDESLPYLLFNGSFTYEEDADFDWTDWALSDTDGRFINNIPFLECDGCGIDAKGSDRLYWFNEDDDYFTSNYFYFLYDDFDKILVVKTENATYEFPFPDTTLNGIGTVGIGPGNLQEWGLTASLLGDEYEVQLKGVRDCDGFEIQGVACDEFECNTATASYNDITERYEFIENGNLEAYIVFNPITGKWELYSFDINQYVLTATSENSDITSTWTILIGTLTSFTITGAVCNPIVYSDKIRFKRRKLKCAPGTKNYKIIFLDQKGSWATHNFNGPSTTSNLIGRNSFDGQNLKRWTGNDFKLNRSDFSEKIISINDTNTYTIRTDYIEQEEWDYLNDLILSRAVYHLDNGIPRPIIVKTNNYEGKKLLRSGRDIFTLQFVYSNKDMRN